MSTRKIERALYGPSTTEVALGALLGLLLGVFLACVYLVTKQPQKVSEVPKDPLTGTVYYRLGSEDATKSVAWQTKQAEFLAGGTVDLVEEELNAWAAAQFAPVAPAAKPAASADTPPPPPAEPDFLAFSRPNFHVTGDHLQIAVQLTLNYSGLSYSTLALVTGSFVRKDDQVVFAADKIHVGSCPMHVLPGVRKKTADWVLASLKLTDDHRVAWTKVERVSIGGGIIKIAVR